MKRILCTVLIAAGALLAQDHPTRVVVTVEASKDATPPALNKDDIIDDGADSALGTEFEELHKFVLEQPPTTKIGIGYLRNGSVDALQKPTADHAAAAKAIRLPLAQPGASLCP